MKHKDIKIGMYLLHKTKSKYHKVLVEEITPYTNTRGYNSLCYQVIDLADGRRHMVYQAGEFKGEIEVPPDAILPRKEKTPYIDWLMSLGQEEPPHEE